MRLLTVEIVDGETTGKRAAWSLPAAMWSRRRQSGARKNTVDHCAEVLSTTMIAGNTPMRLLILETIDGETVGECVAWSLPIGMWAQRRRGEEIVVNGDQHVKALSTPIIEGGTPMRLLILETIDGETNRERIAWSLPAAMWSRRRQSGAKKNTVDHYAEVLSITMIAGGTPMRLLILETIDGEIARERVARPLSAATWVQRQRGGAMVVNGNLRITALSTVRNAGSTPVRLLILETIDGEIIGKRAAWSLSAATWARHCPL